MTINNSQSAHKPAKKNKIIIIVRSLFFPEKRERRRRERRRREKGRRERRRRERRRRERRRRERGRSAGSFPE